MILLFFYDDNISILFVWLLRYCTDPVNIYEEQFTQRLPNDSMPRGGAYDALDVLIVDFAVSCAACFLGPLLDYVRAAAYYYRNWWIGTMFLCDERRQCALME